MSTTQNKPRARCTGCAFSYTLGRGSGEYKGLEVIRKHNSRVGPGLCEGAGKPPATEIGEATGDEQAFAERTDVVGAETVEGAPEEHADVTRLVLGLELTARYEHSQWVIRLSPEHTWVGPSVDEVFERIESGLTEDPERYGVKAPVAVPAPEFASPAPVPEMTPVSGQPEPKRDRYSRYLLPGSDGRDTPHTRATTFAKLGSSTFALSEWGERMLIKGMTLRPDLLAMAHGLDVKADRARLNQIADDAQAAGGNKVAANIGTALHGFSENLDAGLMKLEEIPEQWRGRMGQYLERMREFGLTTRREWIERTTAVDAADVSAPLPVAGTLDRILETPSGELVIGDLKSGSDLSYGFAEIAVQLWLYAHGANTHGLFDWNTGTWQKLDRPVSETYAVVMHLPADGDGCTLYRVDLTKGREYAQVSGRVQSRQKDKQVASPLNAVDLAPVAPPRRTDMDVARELLRDAPTVQRLNEVYAYAVASGKFLVSDLAELKRLAAARWTELNG